MEKVEITFRLPPVIVPYMLAFYGLFEGFDSEAFEQTHMYLPDALSFLGFYFWDIWAEDEKNNNLEKFDDFMRSWNEKMGEQLRIAQFFGLEKEFEELQVERAAQK